MPVVLAIAGCIALLVGLFGGGIKAKEIEVPRISALPRISSSILGIVLIGISIWLSLPPSDRMSQSPTETTQPEISTPSQFSTIEPTQQPTLTPSPTPELGIPVITAIKLREDSSSGSLIIYQDIYFYDPDGDTNFIQWKVLSSTIADISVTNGSVHASSEEQKAGTFATGTWGCNNGKYSIKFQVTLLDSAGHESNPFEYSIECK
jgi:hypothetical protein